jgi:hypothetical protein
MASLPVRDPVGDHLLTPKNAALVVIDYQPSQFAGVRSMDRDLLLENVVSTVKTAKAFGMPIVHSTINVATGRGQPTVPELAELLEDNPPIDRTTTNAWEDADFLAAVRATGRRKLILCALWTEICMAFPALDALREGYDGSQLMQVYVQKSTSTTLPLTSSAVSGGELSQPVAPSKPGKRPSEGNGVAPGCRRAPNHLMSLPTLTLPLSATARRSRRGATRI